MSSTFSVALGVGVGVGIGVMLTRGRHRRTSAAPVSWGWFTGAEGVTAAYSREAPSTLLCFEGKVPVRTGGGIAWLSVSPEPVLGGGCLSVPIGHDDSGIVIVNVPTEKHERAEALLKAGGEYKWVALRALLYLPAQGRAYIEEIETIVRGVSLLAWHRDSAFSGTNGQPTAYAPATAGRRRKTANGRSLYPRMDSVAIVLTESADGERCLLGRQATYPTGMYTCISGFVEHGESAENAAVREVAEETSVRCEPGSARLVASQPWPCGRGNHCELMLGVHARARAEAEAIDVGSTSGVGRGELSDARWFSRAEAKAMVARSTAPPPSAAPSAATEGVPTLFYVPPPLAIAHRLIERWAAGELATHSRL